MSKELCIRALKQAHKHGQQPAESFFTIRIEYIEIWYNRQRIHGVVGYRTPDGVERQYFEERLKGAGAHCQVSA
ncbi:hypothetical protein Alches_28680 [Alicyclobacillus hesperidum subsp. aegles]|uniref:hypothetical protein n=1 Tax=Alicyclobacillus hesperidum TaxID=89784 RepID=UPI00222A4EC1|nr:hypothetical protein [Alicyclobacillus hesperidum]GLG02826.1 hypothetical protein Alches_28680 [Alicyclobacillus hesperidum subsp. aegles]